MHDAPCHDHCGDDFGRDSIKELPIEQGFASIRYPSAFHAVGAPSYLHGLHIDPLLTAVATILTGMPIGLRRHPCCKYGANAEFASACVFTSTVTSLVTVPFLALFL